MRLNCGHEATLWREEPPASTHRYRVECAVCPRTFVKWGNEAELQSLQAAGTDVTIVPYKEPPPPPTLDAFFEN